MPRQTSASTTSDNQESSRKAINVLVVDQDKSVGDQLLRCLGQTKVKLVQVDCISEAFKYLNKKPIDLAIIDSNLPDGSGLALAKRLRRGYVIHAIVMTDQPTLDCALEAIRVGAVDIIVKPFKPDEVKQRVDEAVVRLRADQKKEKRIKKLRQICKKLNHDRDEIASQVDILCNDLVIAYQELAQQVSLLTQTHEYTNLIRQELDLETLLRRTLEYILQKIGPTNAAIYLPASTEPEEYSLGGYVNYECNAESAEILLQHLADVLAPKMVETKWPMHFTDSGALEEWLGESFPYLSESHLLTFPCRHEDDTLAVVVLFRHHNQPFGSSAVHTCTSIAPLLAQSLAKVVNIYHRLAPLDDDDLSID